MTDNGRIKLSWQQLVWGIATLAAVLGTWYDMRAQMALMRQEIKFRVVEADREHERMWRAIEQAHADPKPKR